MQMIKSSSRALSRTYSRLTGSVSLPHEDLFEGGEEGKGSVRGSEPEGKE